MGFIINGQTVEHQVVEDEFEAIKQHYQNLGEVVCCDRDEEFMNYAKENVLNRTLMYQASLEKFGEPSDADIDATIARLKEEHGSEEAFYENTGYGEKDESKIRRQVSTTLTVDRLVEDAIGEEPEPTEDELKEFYQTNLDRYMSAEEVRAAHIFREPKTQQEADVCFGELREVRKRALAGEDYDKLAAEVSDKKEADEIDLGFFKRGDLMHEIEIMTFSMEDGEISPVIATHFGLHILKKTGHKMPEPIPFEELQDKIRETFVADRREGRINAAIDELKAKAEIEETEPVYGEEVEQEHEHEPA